MTDAPFDPMRQIADLVEAALEATGDEHDERFQHEGDGDVGDDALLVPPEDFPAETIKANAELDQNDTDNASRMINLFGPRFLNVREVGLHVWSGRFWNPEGGEHQTERFAQQTARLMKQEAGYIEPSPGDRILIEAAKPLRVKLPEDLSETEKAALEAGMPSKWRPNAVGRGSRPIGQSSNREPGQHKRDRKA